MFCGSGVVGGLQHLPGISINSGTIELQSTFYDPPAPDLAEKWRQDAPQDLRFCVKAWQLITHPSSSPTCRKLKTQLPESRRHEAGGFQSTAEVWRAGEATLSIACALHAAVILFQFPRSFRPTEQSVRNLEAFFHAVGACLQLLAWEPRGQWSEDLVRDLCTRLGLIHCVGPVCGESGNRRGALFPVARARRLPISVQRLGTARTAGKGDASREPRRVCNVQQRLGGGRCREVHLPARMRRTGVSHVGECAF